MKLNPCKGDWMQCGCATKRESVHRVTTHGATRDVCAFHSPYDVNEKHPVGWMDDASKAVTITDTYREEFFAGYLACALWSTTDYTTEEFLDANYGPEDIDPASLASLREGCDAFITAHAADLLAYDRDGRNAGDAGHDYWLTRNGHGAGFWDRGMGELGDRLSDAAHADGEVDLYVGDNGTIYAS